VDELVANTGVETLVSTDDCSVRQTQETQVWSDALLAADVFALALHDKNTFSSVGIRVNAQAGPVRDAWFAALQSKLPKRKYLRLPVGVGDEQLIGGLDLNATLLAGSTVVRRGILAEADSEVLVVPMADAMDTNIAAQIAMVMDDRKIKLERDGLSSEIPTRFGLVVFDESEAEEAGIAECLNDRLMLHIDLSHVSIRAVEDTQTRNLITQSETPVLGELTAKQYEDICQMGLAFGLSSIRPASQLAIVSKCLAGLRGSRAVEQSDVVEGVRLSLLGRATTIPEIPDQQQQEMEQTDEDHTDQEEPQSSDQEMGNQEQSDGSTDVETPPDDVLLDALAANLPSGLLEQLRATAKLATQRNAKGAKGRSGSLKKAVTRGRRLSSRRGELRRGNRLDLIATLRAAVPWQKARHKETKFQNGAPDRVQIRPSDFYIKRYKQKSGSTCLFVVDASGSTALNRLAETKGAVELLLGESYARRDHVGLVSFRGRSADVLLPPTRSLVRAKRALAALPGGGGTPLASGLYSAFELAAEERRQGRTATIVVLTDGSANVDMAGMGGRPKALQDALQVATCIRSEGFDVMLIDVGRQPSGRAADLAQAMDATYVPMPFASSTSLSNAVRQQAG
jgi:magnesium chelatase subunit D